MIVRHNAINGAPKPQGPALSLFPKLFRDLGSPSYQERTSAIARVRALSVGELNSLIGIIETRLHRRKVYTAAQMPRRKMATLILLAAWILLTTFGFPLFFQPMHGEYITLILLSAVVLGGIGFLSAAGCIPEGLTFTSRLQTSLTLIAGDIEDARLLPFALSHLWNSSGFINTSVRDGVKQLLPKVRAEDAAFWNTEQKRTLLKLLDPPYGDPELIVRVLRALEQIGDEAALPAVKRLASMQQAKPMDALRGVAKRGLPYRVWGQDSICQAAIKCQTVLEARALSVQQAATLLRASNQEDATAPETLLRPLPSQSENTPVEQLLRTL